ncbi:hypothetical protein CRYUN_Cryun34aG0065600 [Craigia yunnanensis]
MWALKPSSVSIVNLILPRHEEDRAAHVKAPNISERAKEEVEAIIHTDKTPHHHKETHGRSDDIDEDTLIDDIKGPNVFEMVKKEVEAIVGAIHPKKEFKGS